MKYSYSILLCSLFAFSCLNSNGQWYRVTEEEMAADKMQKNFIGAELPTDPKYYHKTRNGLDSVTLGSFTIMGMGKKRFYSVEGTTPPKDGTTPYFKGTIANGQMQEGELYFEDFYLATKFHYKGAFINNRAAGVGIFTRTSMNYDGFQTSCKAYFENGYISGRGLMKLDVDSSGTPTLFYSGDIILGDYLAIVRNGYGSYFRTGYVRPSFYKLYGTGVANAYYEGQVFWNICTGFGIYNTYDYNRKKTSNFKVGLLAADYPVNTFSVLPVSMEVPDKPEIKNPGLYQLLPKIELAKGARFIYNGRNYTGMQYNNKPYGFGIAEDADGFYEIGFWKDGVRISTYELLGNLLPDSTVLTPREVVNKISRVTTKYNSKKNKYINEEETQVATISYYGSVNAEGKIEGWGFRTGGYETEVGIFLPFVPESNKKKIMPKAAEVFKLGYAVTYGDGSEKGYIVEKNRYRFYTNTQYSFYASQVVPYGGIPLGQRDTTTIALTEYRDKRDYEVEGYKAYIAARAAEYKKKEAERQESFDAMFLRMDKLNNDNIKACLGNFYMDRSGKYLYKIISYDNRNTLMAEKMAVFAISSQNIYITANELLSSGNFRKVQNYITCRSCHGKGSFTNSYTYTADYEYTFGAKVKTITTQTVNCGCVCGLEPAIFGAKRDW